MTQVNQTQFPFLSPEWIEEVKKLRDNYSGEVPESPIEVKFNINVNRSPHHDDRAIEAHIDSSKGQTVIDSGHLEDPELTVSLDYEIAKSMFISRDPAKVMEAFFGGKILVEGDASKLPILMAQNVNPPPETIELIAAIETLTADD
jgi:hypothetical protein